MACQLMPRFRAVAVSVDIWVSAPDSSNESLHDAPDQSGKCDRMIGLYATM